jgi:hypothetical protein
MFKPTPRSHDSLPPAAEIALLNNLIHRELQANATREQVAPWIKRREELRKHVGPEQH